MYPGGLALRFARVKRYRSDKTAMDADTFSSVRAIYGQTLWRVWSGPVMHGLLQPSRKRPPSLDRKGLRQTGQFDSNN